MAAFAIGCIILISRFEWIERIFGFSGLLMIVFAVAAAARQPDWNGLAQGMIPSAPSGGSQSLLLFVYFAVGIFSAMLAAYEVHFYSSGAIEDDWHPKDLGVNFLVAACGCTLGAVLTVSLLVLGAQVFLPQGIFPESINSAILPVAVPLGAKGLVLALLGVMACLGGAAVETALSGGYNLCQFYNLAWGKNRAPKQVPAFTAAWVTMLILALVIAISGIPPLQLINVSVIFGMVVLPATYYPILRVAADPAIMGKHVNNKWNSLAGGLFLVLILVAAIAAIPLMVLTNSGQP